MRNHTSIKSLNSSVQSFQLHNRGRSSGRILQFDMPSQPQEGSMILVISPATLVSPIDKYRYGFQEVPCWVISDRSQIPIRVTLTCEDPKIVVAVPLNLFLVIGFQAGMGSNNWPNNWIVRKNYFIIRLLIIIIIIYYFIIKLFYYYFIGLYVSRWHISSLDVAYINICFSSRVSSSLEKKNSIRN